MSFIKYNNNIIATLQSGEKATLNCIGKLMVGDVSVESSYNMKIQYDGRQIATLESGQKATLLCKGKGMKDNIVITPDIPEEPDTPTEETYTVSGTWVWLPYPGVDTPITYSANVSFTSNNTQFTSITGGGRIGGYLQYDDTKVATFNGFTNEAYRTITFDGVQEVSKEFKEWLEYNAERQTITFTILFYYSYTNTITHTQTLTVPSGMTWREWVETDSYEYGKVHVTNEGKLACGDAGSLWDEKNGGRVVYADEVIENNATYYFVARNK